MCQEAGVDGPLPLDLVRPSGKSLVLVVCVQLLAAFPPVGVARGLLCILAVLTPAPGLVRMLTLLSHLLHHSIGTPRDSKDVRHAV